MDIWLFFVLPLVILFFIFAILFPWKLEALYLILFQKPPKGLSQKTLEQLLEPTCEEDITQMVSTSFCDVRIRIVGDRNSSLTILMLTDPPNTVEHYDAIIQYLKDRALVIVMDIPGFGFSKPKFGFQFSLDCMENCFTELIEKLNRKSYIVVAPCVTGFFAIIAAKNIKITHLVLLQTCNFKEETKWARGIDRYRMLSLPIISQMLVWLRSKTVSHGWYSVAMPRSGTYPTDKHSIPGVDQIQTGSSEDNAAIWRKAFTKIAHKQLDNGAVFPLASSLQSVFYRGKDPCIPPKSVKQPCLVVFGNRDPTHKHTNSRSVTEYLQNFKYEEYEGTGHFPELQQPKRFSEDLFKFVDSQ